MGVFPEYGMILPGGSRVVRLSGLQVEDRVDIFNGMYERTSRSCVGRPVYKKMIPVSGPEGKQTSTSCKYPYLCYYGSQWMGVQECEIGKNACNLSIENANPAKWMFPEAIRGERSSLWNVANNGWSQLAVRIDPVCDGVWTRFVCSR